MRKNIVRQLLVVILTVMLLVPTACIADDAVTVDASATDERAPSIYGGGGT